MAKYRLLAKAKADYRDIGLFTQEQWGIEQRNTYLDALDDAFDELSAMPKMGRSRDDLRRGLRSHVVGQHVIFYRVVRGGVVILRVLHAARDARRAF